MKHRNEAQFNTQIYKDHVNKFKDNVEATQILRNRARGGKSATMWCIVQYIVYSK